MMAEWHAVGDLVGEGDRHLGEASPRQLGLVLAPGEGAGDAAHPLAPLSPVGRGKVVFGDDVADAEAPAGLRTRKASANTAGLSADRLTTQLETITSTVVAGRGMASIRPLRNSTLPAPASAALRRARASISSVMSSP